MKKDLFLIIISLIFHLMTMATPPQKDRKFLWKSDLDNSKEFYGSHIVLKIIESKYIGAGMIMLKDDRDFFSDYSREDKINILKEYLKFEADTNISNKSYAFTPDWGTSKSDNLTIQVEALFSFSRMFMIGYPPLRPVLLDKETGKKIELNKKNIKLLYNIYRKWLIRQEKEGFKNITWPLEKTPFIWEGENSKQKIILIKEF